MVTIQIVTDTGGQQVFEINNGGQIKYLPYKSYQVTDTEGLKYSIYDDGAMVCQGNYSELSIPAGIPATQFADLVDLFNIPDTGTSIDSTLNSIYSTLLVIDNRDGVEETLRNTLAIDDYSTNVLGSTNNLVQSRMFYGYRLFNPNSVPAYIRFSSASLGEIVHVLPAGQIVDVSKSNVADLGLIDTVDLDKNRNFTYLGTNFTLPVVIRLKY